MRAEPARLNSAIAWLFMLGASCFALGTIPAYVHAVGAAADAMTFFVGSIFFTSASYCQLVQAQSPGMTGVDEQRQHARIRACRGPGGRATRTGWRQPRSSPETLFFNHSTFAATVHNLTAAEADKYVWRPDFFGSVLFLVSSGYAISALGVRLRRPQWRLLPWWIAWLNMLGSVAFMVSAIASFVLPSTDTLIDLHAGQRRNVPWSSLLPRRGGAHAARMAGLGAVGIAQRASGKIEICQGCSPPALKMGSTYQ